MAVATPLVHVDCCPSNSSLPVAEHADTKSPCHETRDQLARSSQASLAGPRQSRRMPQQAGATWPALWSFQTPFHTSPARRTTAKGVSPRAPMIRLLAHALQRLSQGWRRRLSVIRGHRHLVQPSLPTETVAIGAASARGVALPQSPASRVTSPRSTLGLRWMSPPVPSLSRSRGSPAPARTPRVEASDGLELARAAGAPRPLLLAPPAIGDFMRFPSCGCIQGGRLALGPFYFEPSFFTCVF